MHALEIIDELKKFGISAGKVELHAELQDFWNVTVSGFDPENITQEYKESVKGSTLSGSEFIKGKNLQVKYILYQNEQVLLLKGSDLRNIGITLINPQIIHGMQRPMPVFTIPKPEFDPSYYVDDFEARSRAPAKTGYKPEQKYTFSQAKKQQDSE